MISPAKKLLNRILFSRTDQKAFLEDICHMLKQGVPVSQAVSTVLELSTGPAKVAAQDILDVIATGKPVSDGLIAWFPISIVEVIRSGEQGGILAEAIEASLKFLGDRAGALTSLLSSLSYPLVVLILGLIVSVFLKYSVFVNFEAIKPVSEWPENARFLMNLSSFVETWWWLILISFVCLVFVIRFTIANLIGDVRKVIDEVPPISFYRDYAGARFMETMGLLLINHIGFKAAMNVLQRNASRYLLWHIKMMQIKLSSGVGNIADVLDTGLVNKADMARLRVMAKGSGFEETLVKLGEQAAERNTRKIIKMGKLIGGLLMAADAAFLMFMVFSIYGVGSFIAT